MKLLIELKEGLFLELPYHAIADVKVFTTSPDKQYFPAESPLPVFLVEQAALREKRRLIDNIAFPSETLGKQLTGIKTPSGEKVPEVAAYGEGLTK